MELEAWARITGNEPKPWEWEILLALDDVAMGHWVDPTEKVVTLFDQIKGIKKDG